jgi:hypothetical protein
MAKANKAAAPAATNSPAVAPVVLVVGARGAKYSGKQGTKYGANGGGTAATWQAVLAAVAANGGTIGYSQLQAVTAAASDKGFAAYAVRNNWLVPQA